MGVSKTSKFSAIFLASVLLFSTVSISSLAGMTPLPNAYAGGGPPGGSLPDLQCNTTLISVVNQDQETAMTYWAAQGVFLWASFAELNELTVAGVRTSVDQMDVSSKGLAFVGSTLYSIDRAVGGDGFAELRVIDPTDASTVGTPVVITLGVETVTGGTGLATHPTTGVLWAVLKIQGQESRILVTIDPSTGIATSIGDLFQKIAAIAFDSSGTLFAISGKGSGLTNVLHTVNTSNANLTLVCSNGSTNAGGSSMALNPNDGELYFSLAQGNFVRFNGGFLNVCNTQNIPTQSTNRALGMTFFESSDLFLFTRSSTLRSMTVDGVDTSIGNMGNSMTGLAFSPGGGTFYTGERFGNDLFTVDPSNASILTTTPITFGTPQPINNVNALAIHPTTGVLWAVLRVNTATSERVLVTIDPSDGMATSIGDVGRISALAFDSSGLLFGVTGEGSIPPETLVSFSQTDATMSILCVLQNGGTGEAIGFNPNDGLLYHMSGSTLYEKILGTTSSPDPGEQVTKLFSIDRRNALLHEIDPTTGQVLNSLIIESETFVQGGTALTTSPSGTLFAVLSEGVNDGGDDVRRLATINPVSGQATNIGVLGEEITALAFKDGVLYGVTGAHPPVTSLDGYTLVSIDTGTAAVTGICDLDPFDNDPHNPVVGFNARDNLLHYFSGGSLDGPILDIPSCTIGNPGETMGFDFEYFIYSLISMILPKADAGGGSGASGVTWSDDDELFFTGSNGFGTIDPDTGDFVAISTDFGHKSKGLAFVTIFTPSGGGGGSGAVGQAGAPTIGVDSDGRQIVPCGVAFDLQCFTISSPFHEEFELFEMMSGTHTISITMWCPKGVSDCAYAAIGVMPYSASMDNPTWIIEVYRDFEGNIMVVKTDPEGFLGEVTVTDQIEGTFWVTSFTIEFKNIDTDPMM